MSLHILKMKMNLLYLTLFLQVVFCSSQLILLSTKLDREVVLIIDNTTKLNHMAEISEKLVNNNAGTLVVFNIDQV